MTQNTKFILWIKWKMKIFRISNSSLRYLHLKLQMYNREMIKDWKFEPPPPKKNKMSFCIVKGKSGKLTFVSPEDEQLLLYAITLILKRVWDQSFCHTTENYYQAWTTSRSSVNPTVTNNIRAELKKAEVCHLFNQYLAYDGQAERKMTSDNGGWRNE